MRNHQKLWTWRVNEFVRRARSERGASLVEYGLLVALIALVCFAAVVFLGGETSDAFSRVGQSVTET